MLSLFSAYEGRTHKVNAPPRRHARQPDRAAKWLGFIIMCPGRAAAPNQDLPQVPRELAVDVLLSRRQLPIRRLASERSGVSRMLFLPEPASKRASTHAQANRMI